MLYCREVEDGWLEFDLDIFHIKTDLIKIPFIYHVKILGLVCDMVDNLESQNTKIKSKLRGMFSLSYLLRILACSDIYSYEGMHSQESRALGGTQPQKGIQARMMFLVKRQVMRLVYYLI
jgi:hypothetical protein